MMCTMCHAALPLLGIFETEQVFRVKKTCGAATPTRITCCRHSQVRTGQHVKTMQPHAKSMSTHSFTQAHSARTVHSFSFLCIPRYLESSNLASHARYTA